MSILLIVVVLIVVAILYVWYLIKNNPPVLETSDYTNTYKVDFFLNWWLKNDYQVSEICRPSTKALWDQGYIPEHPLAKEFDDPVSFFKEIMKSKLKKVKKYPEDEYRKEIDSLNKLTFNYMKAYSDIGREYGIDFQNFSIREFDQKIPFGKVDVVKQSMMEERFSANQQRLLMWLYKNRFGKDCF